EIDAYIAEHGDFKNASRLILVTDDEENGQAAACYTIMKRRELRRTYLEKVADAWDDSYDDAWLYEDEDDTEDEGSLKIGETGYRSEPITHFHPVVSFNVSSGQGGNPYVVQLPECAAGDTDAWGASIVTGLIDMENIESKLEALSVLMGGFQVLLVPERALSHPAVRTYCAEMECGICRVSMPDENYYMEMLTDLCREGGLDMPEQDVMKKAIRKLRKNYGTKFSEEHILKHCISGLGRMRQDGRSVFAYEDLTGSSQEEGAWESFKKREGLRSVKEALSEYRALLMEELRNPMFKGGSRHMIFYGNPGSGKTMSARVAADILAESGISSGAFVEADRSSLIGKYVGHTAPKVREKFEEAKGGVLFVDEAGFFLQEESGGFVQEAMREFIRYMENCPDVTVIFAMYQHEVEDFLRLDDGLRSRIRKLVPFEDYTAPELMSIIKQMLAERGYTMTRKAAETLQDHIMICGKDFGNARGARKLAEACITAHAVRLAAHPECAEKTGNRISLLEAEEAVRKSRSDQALSSKPQTRPIGFRISTAAI
nr:AAA family ATPase [Lachnospiraceae bacterium]